MAIFVTGPHGAGKTLFARLLATDNFPVIELGPTLRNIWKRQSPDITFEEFVQAGETYFGKHFTDAILVEEIHQELQTRRIEDASRLLLVGSRSVAGIQYIKSHISSLGRSKTFVVYIEADEAILYRRYCLRGEQVSIDEFRLILKLDRDMGLEKIRAVADFVIVNDGSVEEFKSRISNLVFDSMDYEKHERL